MTSYRENTIDGLDKEPMLINEFYDRLMKAINNDSLTKLFFVGLYIIPIIILLIQTLFYILWKMYCFFSYLSFKSGIIKVNW